MPGNPPLLHATWRAGPTLALVLVVGLLLSCETAPGQGKTTVDSLPAWRTPLDNRKVNVHDLVAYIHQHNPGVPVRWSDNTYERVSYEWLEEYLKWTWSVNLETGVHYTSESFDCEEFSLAFYLFASRAASVAGQKTSPLIGRIVVRRDHAFGGVEASPGKTHELVVVVTDRGTFVVEPQTSSPHRLIAFEKYHNPILQIVLGD